LAQLVFGWYTVSHVLQKSEHIQEAMSSLQRMLHYWKHFVVLSLPCSVLYIILFFWFILLWYLMFSIIILKFTKTWKKGIAMQMWAHAVCTVTPFRSLFEFSLHGFRVSSYKAVAEGTALMCSKTWTAQIQHCSWSRFVLSAIFKVLSLYTQ